MDPPLFSHCHCHCHCHCPNIVNSSWSSQRVGANLPPIIFTSSLKKHVMHKSMQLNQHKATQTTELKQPNTNYFNIKVLFMFSELRPKFNKVLKLHGNIREWNFLREQSMVGWARDNETCIIQVKICPPEKKYASRRKIGLPWKDTKSFSKFR